MYKKYQEVFKQCRVNMLQSMDIFGQPPKLEVLQKQKYTTNAGCLFTFIILSLTISYFLTQFVNLLQKASPRIVSNEFYMKDSQPFSLYNDNFTLAITVADRNSKSIVGQNIYYNITVNHCIRQRIINDSTGSVLINLTCTQLPIAPCKSEDFDNTHQYEYFKTIKLGVVQCLDRQYLKENPPILQSQLAGMLYQYIYVQMSACKNSTEYNGCASQEEINNVLLEGHYSVYYSDYLLQFANPDLPFSQYINIDINSFSITTSKMLIWKYKITETKTDDGWLIGNIRSDYNLRRSDSTSSIELYNEEYLMIHYIQLDSKITKYERSYIKIQSILGQIGGIWQFFIIIFSFIINPLINNQMIIEIANQLFHFEKKQSIKSLDQLIQENPLTKQQGSINDSQLNIQNQNELNMLNQGFFQTLKTLFGCNKNEKLLLDKAKIIISSQLDIVNILDKLQEQEYLKKILLTDEQLILFDLLPKPILNINNLLSNKSIIQESNNNQLISNIRYANHKKLNSRNFQDYCNSYNVLLNGQNKSEINNKLLQQIDKNIFSQFDQVNSSDRKSMGLSPLVQIIGSKFEDSIYEPQIQRPK